MCTCFSPHARSKFEPCMRNARISFYSTHPSAVPFPVLVNRIKCISRPCDRITPDTSRAFSYSPYLPCKPYGSKSHMKRSWHSLNNFKQLSDIIAIALNYIRYATFCVLFRVWSNKSKYRFKLLNHIRIIALNQYFYI